jgi:aerobic-type carbon monoxide dehydrogenase small subunit (CoxS/CutS family)
MVLTVKRLLEENPAPSEEEIKVALGGNLCRCGCYIKILDAVQLAAERLATDASRGGKLPLASIEQP